MERKNCWEVLACGREPGGEKTQELGVCPAAMPSEYDGIHGGVHAGRFCWVISGTYCGGEIQGSMAHKILDCIECEFLKQVHEEESGEFALTPKRAKSKPR